MNANEEFVISGISGRYPDCEDIDQFTDELISGKCFVTSDEDRWPNGTYGLPDGIAKLRNIDKFDAEFFGVRDEEANVWDPIMRIILEETYSCICDAGINPETLRGTNTGFFSGSWIDDAVEAALKNDIECKENIFTFVASKIPYYFDFRGGACHLNNACASSLTALECAIISIRSGQCDRAIVAAFNLTLNPTLSYWQNLLKTLAPDSICKLWDEKSNGYVKGEAGVCVLIQKSSEAKRIYAKILSIKTNTDGFKPEGFTYPGWRTQKQLIMDTMKEAGIDGKAFAYFEAHGTGTPVGDPAEAKSIAEAVCSTRTEPLIMGSIKATIGHTEGASGLTSLTKIIAAYQKGVLAPSLNHEIPNKNIPQLFDGSLIVYNKPIEFKGGIVGINNFGIGGGNATLIVDSFDDKFFDENSYRICDPIPRLVLICGRNEALIEQNINKLQNNCQKLTKDFLSLYNEISNIRPETGMTSRGFILFDEQKMCFNTMVDKSLMADNKRRSLWFVFTGIGSQWPAMAQSLIKFEIFEKSFNRSISFLESIGADIKILMKYLLESDIDGMDDKHKPTIPSLAVIQIGIVDLLYELGVKPDGIIGHSIGEIVAAYADGCITAEDALKIANSIHNGIIADNSQDIDGVMAAIGLSWAEAQNHCFGSIAVVCNNSPKMVTMTGNTKDMKQLIENLENGNIFVRIVENHGLAAHSPLMKTVEKELIEITRNLKIKPKQRTKRWLSTTFPENEWSDPLCQWPSGEYFAANLCRPVLFYDSLLKAPENCFFAEIGPFGQLRHSIAKSFDKKHNILYKEFIQRNKNSENLLNFLTTLGQIYISGQTLDISKLYPKVEYPVPRGTDFISPLITWNHKKSYFVTKFPEYFSPNVSKSVQKFPILLSENQYLSDHTVDGRVLYPAAGYISLVWKTLATSLGVSDFKKFSIEFREYHIIQATHLTDDETEFKCHYFKENSKFIIENNNTICGTGYAFPLKNPNDVSFSNENTKRNDKLFLSGNDFYKETRVLGYEYGKCFQGVTSISSDGTEATVKWMGELIPFIDALFQTTLLKDSNRMLRVPTRIESLKINPNLLFNDRQESGENEFEIDVNYDCNTNELKANGFYLKNIYLSHIPRKSTQKGELLLENYDLISYEELNAIEDSLAKNIDIYVEECLKTYQQMSNNEINNSFDNNNNKLNEDLDTDEEYKDNGKTLLKYIKRVNSKTDKQNVKFIEDLDLDNDFIQSTVLCERFLRPNLDVFVENNDLNKNISIVEINTSKQILFPNVMKTIARTALGPTLSNFQYTLCHSNKQLLSQNILDSKRLKFTDFVINKSVIPYHTLGPQNLIIYRDPNVSFRQSDIDFDYQLLLSSIETTLTVGGFLLAIIRDNVLQCEQNVCPLKPEELKKKFQKFVYTAEEVGLQYVCKKSDSFTISSVLFRKVDKSVKNEIQIEVNNECLDWLEPLKNAMKDSTLDRIWLTSDQQFSGIIGLIKGLQKEDNGFKVRALLRINSGLSLNKALKIAKQSDLVQNVFRDSVWSSFRHICVPEVLQTRPTSFGQIRQLKFGDLSSFKWCESPNALWPGIRQSMKEILIDIYYSSLNFKDVMHATGKLPPHDLTSHMVWDDVVLGLEFVGRRRDTGARVMGLNSSKALSTSIIVNDEFLWSVPDKWSMAEAATVPCVYATAYYALIIRGKLRAGETVLIHAGTGGVGQAAINICLSMNCKVLTTVGNNEKRVWIQKQFPLLKDSCIASSRDVSFDEMVMNETNGRGVDLILNSLTDQMFWTSLRCLATNGRFCEIGKYQFVNNDDMDLSLLLRNKTFHGIYLDALFTGLNNLVTNRSVRERQQMWCMLSEGIKLGVVKPLPKTTFNASDTESAFRFMASGRHIGKVLIQMRTEEPIPKCIARPLIVDAIPQTFFNPKKSYIITGGLGGMGLELMYWMYERNARKFVLTSRSGIKTQTQEFAVKRLRQKKCKIIISRDNASDICGANEVLSKAQGMGEIGGIFLLSLILDDDLIDNQTVDKFERVMNPKSTQALIFDQLVRQLSQPIDYFVAFSSVSCGRGIAGQTNYAFTNSIIERICDQRRADGFHGLAIEWGYVGDVGFVADNLDEKALRSSLLLGFSPQRITSCWTQLDRFLQTQQSVCSSFVRIDSFDKDSDSKVSLIDAVSNIMGIKDMSGLNPNTNLLDLGLDSLMSVEVRNLFERECRVSLTTKEVSNITIQQLRDGIN